MAPVKMLSSRKNWLREYVEKSVIKVKAEGFDSTAYIRLLYEKEGVGTSLPRARRNIMARDAREYTERALDYSDIRRYSKDFSLSLISPYVCRLFARICAACMHARMRKRIRKETKACMTATHLRC